MFDFTVLTVLPAQTLPEREEIFPMQEQAQGPGAARTEKPAAVLLAERAAESGSGPAAPLFVP